MGRAGLGTCRPGRLTPFLFVSDLTLYVFGGRKVFIILNYYCFEINGRLSSLAALHDLWRDRVESLGWGPNRVDRPLHPTPSSGPGTTRMTSKTRTKLL